MLGFADYFCSFRQTTLLLAVPILAGLALLTVAALSQAGNAYATSHKIIGQDSCLSSVAALGGSATWKGSGINKCQVVSGDLVIKSGDSLVVDFVPGDGPINLVITSSSTLTNNGTLELTTGGILTNNRTFVNTGTVNNFRQMENLGTINNDGGTISGRGILNTGTINNTGTLVTSILDVGGEIENRGNITNSGTVNMYGLVSNTNGGIFVNAKNGTVNFGNEGGIRNGDNTGIIYNFGTIGGNYGFGGVGGAGVITNDGGIISGGISVGGTFINTNSGTIVIISNGVGDVAGTLINTNSSMIHNFGYLSVVKSGVINDTGVIKNSFFVTNVGTINNSGTFENSNTINNDCNGIINGPITGNPPVDVCNDPPVAFDQSVTTDANTSVSIRLNATDPDTNGLTFSIVSPPSHGILSGRPPDVIYTPAANYEGPDSFTLKARDGEFDSNIATVSITVKATTTNDTAPPSISISSPSNGTILNSTTFVISGTASDSGSGVKKVEVSIDSGAYELATGTASWSYSVSSPLSNGSHTITIKATDNTDNISTRSVTITAQPAPPTTTPKPVTGNIVIANSASCLALSEHDITATWNSANSTCMITDGTLAISESGSLAISSATLEVAESASIQNDGTINSSGVIRNHGTIENSGNLNNSNTIDNFGAIENSGRLVNSGYINSNNLGGNMTGSGAIVNSGYLR